MTFPTVPVNSTYLRPILILSGILLVLWLLTLQQSNPEKPESLTEQQQQRLDSLRVLMGTNGIETLPKEESNLFQNALPVFLILFVALIALWYWSKKKGITPENNGKILAELQLGPGQHVKAIQFAGEVHLLGITAHQINTIKTISIKQWEENQTKTTKPINESEFSKLLASEKDKSE